MRRQEALPVGHAFGFQTVLLQETEHGFAPSQTFGAQQNPSIKGRLKILQCLQRLICLAVDGQVWQRMFITKNIRQYLTIIFQTACKNIGREIQMLWKQRRIGFVTLRHGVTRFDVAPKTVCLGVNVAQRDKQRIFADIVKQRFQLVFKKQRQVIFHARAEVAVADSFVHSGIVRIAIDFFTKTAAENLLRLAVGGELVCRQQADFGNGGNGALRFGIEGFNAVDFIVKQIDAVRHFAAHREQIDNTAAHGKFACRNNMGHMVITCIHQIAFQTAYIQSLPCFQPKRTPCQKRHGRQLLHCRGDRYEQYVRRAAFNLPQCRQALRHQILMRRKTLVRQRFPVRQEHGRIVRTEKQPGRLKA